MDKYGYIIGGKSVVGQIGGAHMAEMVEMGVVITNKNWYQRYSTEYKFKTTVTAGFGGGSFALFNKGNYKNTFSDWAGPVSGWTGNYGIFSITKEQSATYSTWGLSLGWGVSFPTRGTGGWIQGTTTLIGKPYYVDPANHMDGDF